MSEGGQVPPARVHDDVAQGDIGQQVVARVHLLQGVHKPLVELVEEGDPGLGVQGAQVLVAAVREATEKGEGEVSGGGETVGVEVGHVGDSPETAAETAG